MSAAVNVLSNAPVAAAQVWTVPSSVPTRIDSPFRANVTLHTMFNDPKHKPALEVWQAATFGIGYETLVDGPVGVRICHPEVFPDFRLRVDGQVFDFESTMTTGTKLGKRYRGNIDVGAPRLRRPETLPPFNPEWITEAVRKKAKKHYGSRVHLLVYVNWSRPQRDCRRCEGGRR